MMLRVEKPSPKQQGFTLIELLVAMVITAVIGAMTFAAVTTARRSIEVMEKRAGRLSELNGFFLRFTKDVAHIVPRGASVDNQAVQALSYSSINGDGLSFTNGSRANPGFFPRSALQRVSYQLDDGKLIRKSWSNVDGSSDEAKEWLILDKVDAVELRFVTPIKVSQISGRAPSLRWINSWPPRLNSVAQANPEDKKNPFDALPMALELKIELEPWGEITRVFEVNNE